MPTFDYDTAVADALGLITEFGQTVTVNRLTGASYTPSTGAIAAGSSEYTAIVVSIPATPGKVSAFDDGDREDYIKGRLRFFIFAASGLASAPKAGDRIEFESNEWEISGVTPLNPAGTAIIYNVGAREGGATT